MKISKMYVLFQLAFTYFSPKPPSMAIPLTNSRFSYQIKYQRPSSFIIFLFAFFASMNFVFPHTSATDCALDFQFSPSGYNSNCAERNWDGFLNNTCCGFYFNGYLQALGKRASQTGQIFLNSTEQKACLTPLTSIDGYVSRCGIENLTSGAGGCSDYSVTDVVNKLGNRLRSLGEDCKVLGLDGESDHNSCSACLRRWEEMGVSLNNSENSMKGETDVCRFAVLVSLTSLRIYDEKWVQAVYKCLGEKSLPIGIKGHFLRIATAPGVVSRLSFAEDVVVPSGQPTTDTTQYSAEDNGGKAEETIKLNTDLWILIGSITGITVIIIVAVIRIFCRRPTEAKLQKRNDASNDSQYEEFSCRKISIKEIYSATNNLSALNFIGQGIAGKVYKGILPSGHHVAVKHIINDGEMETFVREVKSLSHVRHPNLVELLGHCEGKDECFLIYELCHNGNLSEWLFGKDKLLSWIQRLDIATDCARGLWFLHTYPEGCIVHRDIKPTNILICANFQGKLSDFGLSKVIDMGKSYVSSEVRGTFGYVDPEYQKNSRVTSSGDVYSFGIVLLQLISGKRVINMDLTRPMHLDKMAKILTNDGNMTDFADPKLNGEYSVEAFELILKLAISCTGLKQQRPSMEQVVRRLEKAQDISTRVKSVETHFTLNME